MEQNRWHQALTRTRRATFGRLASILGTSELTSSFWEQLKEILILADIGIGTVELLIDELRNSSISEGIIKGEQVCELLKVLLIDRLQSVPNLTPDARPLVVILIGINGSGKTTTAARITHRWQKSGHKVLLAAADTYRAAASDQLKIWGDRLGVDVIAGQPGSDPGAVVYDAAQSTLAREIDILVVDTSGRMHTQHNLMAELQKICRVAGKVISGAPHQILLVLDATTGQNSLAQAQSFAKAVDITGVVLAKLDSSAKGGMGFAVSTVLNLPILYVGIGEELDDLSPFEPSAFVDGLLAECEVEPKH